MEFTQRLEASVDKQRRAQRNKFLVRWLDRIALHDEAAAPEAGCTTKEAPLPLIPGRSAISCICAWVVLPQFYADDSPTRALEPLVWQPVGVPRSFRPFLYRQCSTIASEALPNHFSSRLKSSS